ncbi:uncharacterized protein SPPG_03572 [Spizellomyces punctatus DAOM BR117]|uniref:TIGR00659 family protein n=1 Tax=Spizellomyces punctatus (strain DAOM BR117) TaxID=645134 RepID=A0A0L0HLK0_SPIPD|nr:uncharacterized protein SPPG_03572 [Spizellomyces punctatus DAOM BR117]KND01780.1 hypothetical protein SPPG_03572 [Spizellomyces punctatus DAOM BR117]|eukprot:XP_016609819.1 hypothetical protein SPPG_03572 [Spizellomyces punctatus DAOM BR117]
MPLRQRCSSLGPDEFPEPVIGMSPVPTLQKRVRLVFGVSLRTLAEDWIFVPFVCCVVLLFVWGIDVAVSSRVPASVLSMLILFFTLLLCTWIPSVQVKVDRTIVWADPGVEWLLKWMTVMFSPAVVVMPRQKGLGGREVGRVIGVFAIGYVVVLLLVIGMVIAVRRCMKLLRRVPKIPIPDHEEMAIELDRRPSTTLSEKSQQAPPPLLPRLPIHPSTLLIYISLFVPSLALALLTDVVQPVHLCITVLAYFVGLALPPKLKMVLHPLLVCGGLTILGVWCVGGMKGQSLNDAIGTYSRSIKAQKLLTALASHKPFPTPGAGDVLYSLLDAAVVALAIRMYKERVMMRQQIVPIMTVISTVSIFSLVFHVWLSRSIGMDRENSLGMSCRFVTTPLSLQIFSSVLQEANASLGVVMVIVSGMVGDVVGKWAMRRVGVSKDDVLVVGVTTGVTSHAVGTASLLGTNPQAAALSSLTFVLFGTASVVWVTIPIIAEKIRSLAG